MTDPQAAAVPVIPEGMREWHGGETAPVDWDGGRVMIRDGSVYLHDNHPIGRWLHGGQRVKYYPHRTDLDIIAYIPAPTQAGGEDTNTVAFVQSWLMNADYDPSQFDKDFAAAIDARCAHHHSPAPVAPIDTSPERVEEGADVRHEGRVGASVAKVEMIETRPSTWPFEDSETPPLWRVSVGEYCADFDFEQAARNFAGAINAATRPPADAEGLREALEPFLRLHRMQEPLSPPDDAPLHRYLPNAWPTMGDLRRLATLSTASQAAPVSEPATRSTDAGALREALRIAADWLDNAGFDLAATDARAALSANVQPEGEGK